METIEEIEVTEDMCDWAYWYTCANPAEKAVQICKQYRELRWRMGGLEK